MEIVFCREKGGRVFHNIEMGPAEIGQKQSQLNVLAAKSGEHLVHTNK